jgi:hypothetical protein
VLPCSPFSPSPAAIATVGAIAIAMWRLPGIAVAAIAVAVVLLLVASPVLLIGWLIWRLARSPSSGGARPELA